MPNKPKMIWTLCEWCGRPMRIAAKERNRGGGRFCGIKCSGLWWSSQDNWSLKKYHGCGPDSVAWKGGRTLHSRGYIYRYAPDHPRACNGYVLEHILIAESMLDRHLYKGETVHHKNGIRSDNRPENIEIFDSPGAHTKYHAALRRAAQKNAAV